MKYWHEISQDEVNEVIASKKTYQFLVDNYKQPDWCSYPDALMGVMGCWSLTDNGPDGLRTKVSHDFCKTCDQYKK